MLTVPRVLGALVSLALLAYVFVFADAINDDGANDAEPDGSAALPASEEVPVKTPDEPQTEFPKPGQVFVGAMTETGPYDFADLEAFAAAAGQAPQVMAFSQGWERDAFDRALFDEVARRRMMPMLAWEPWDYQAPAPRQEQPKYRLRQIIDGEFDDYITSWAEGIADLGYPVALRFAHEMNGFWYPWSEQSNDNQPGEYVEAWRHVHDLFTRAGADDVVWVWSPNVHYENATDMQAMYPGDDYVDWVGLVGYYGTAGHDSYRSFEEIFQPSIVQLRTFTDKPLVITELAATDAHGRMEEWISEFFQMLPNHPDIIGFVWFEVDKENDWRIASSTAASAAFAEGVSHERYSEAWTPNTTPRLTIGAPAPGAPAPGAPAPGAPAPPPEAVPPEMPAPGAPAPAPEAPAPAPEALPPEAPAPGAP